ncbi:MAG: hypothetical protein K2W82_17975 [Candidatus Obscuribacterales bacterium]|nr:hypothetical protein [Candidatus Obscuribacterales bacterium]
MEKKRYTDLKALTGRTRGDLRKLLEACYPEVKALEDFAEKLGDNCSKSINWGQALTYASSDLITYCMSRGGIGNLLEELETAHPENSKVKELIEQLTASGYLQDTQKPPRQTTNPYNTNWLHRYPTDNKSVVGEPLTMLLGELDTCFSDINAIEAFVLDNFPDDYGKQLAHGIDRGQPKRTVLEVLVAGFARVRRLTAFVHAVQDFYNKGGQQPLLLYLATALVSLPKAAPAPAATPPAVKPAVSQPQTQALRVKSEQIDLSVQLQTELRDLLVKAFGHEDFSSLTLYDLGQHLDHIVGPGSLNKRGSELIAWCLENVKLAELLNGMVKRRPARSDIPAFVRKLAAEGVLKLEA